MNDRDLRAALEAAAARSGGRLRVPGDGWDRRQFEFWCPVCERTVTHRSIFLNLDVLIEMGLTQAEWALATHKTREHTLWWCPVCNGTGEVGSMDDLSPCPNGCASGRDRARWLMGDAEFERRRALWRQGG